MAAFNQFNNLDFPDSNSNSNSKYKQEIEKLSEQIISSIKTIDRNGNGLMNQDDMLTFLQNRVPPGRPLDISLFQKFFREIDVNNEGKIDIKDFTNQYIRNSELLKMNLESQRNVLETEKVKKAEYERKKMENKNERLNKEEISENSTISIEIGALTLVYSYLSGYDNCYFQLLMDNKEQKTSVHKMNDLNFNEKITFPIKSLNQVLYINFYNSSEQIHSKEVPINLLNEKANEELELEFQIEDYNGNELFSYNPKILLVTSYYQLYQTLYDQSISNIEKYQKKIDKLSENFDALSAPFRSLLMNVSNQSRTIGGTAFENQMVDRVENLLKSTLKKQDIKWMMILKVILYLCIAAALITTFAKPDFFSLFIEIVIVIIINTNMNQTLFDNFLIFLGMLLFSIGYDLIDYFCLRTTTFKTMKSANSSVAFFGFIGFVGKVLALLCIWIQKIKFSKTGVAN